MKYVSIRVNNVNVYTKKNIYWFIDYCRECWLAGECLCHNTVTAAFLYQITQMDNEVGLRPYLFKITDFLTTLQIIWTSERIYGASLYSKDYLKTFGSRPAYKKGKYSDNVKAENSNAIKKGLITIWQPIMISLNSLRTGNISCLRSAILTPGNTMEIAEEKSLPDLKRNRYTLLSNS